MSRRPPPAANASARPGHATRRLVLGAAAAPLLLGASGVVDNDPAVQGCDVWVARNAEHERLSVRWAKIEARLHREHNWLTLTRTQQRAFSEWREMDDLDDRIEALSDENSAVLKALPAIAAVSPPGICGKLTIAITETKNDCEDVHDLIVSILRDYRALHGGA